MLTELRIENFGIIENLTLSFGTGLNVITGETGTGKSLVLQAIDVVLGGRAGGRVVRREMSRAVVGASFELSSTIRQVLQAGGYPVEEGLFTLRREVGSDGRSRAFINGTGVALSQLRELAGRLIEIHGQHEQQRLLSPELQLDSLDHYASTWALRAKVSELYHRYSEKRKQLQKLQFRVGEREQRLEYLYFALDEIDAFGPQAEEYDALLAERSLIQNSGLLFQDFNQAYTLLREQDQAILDRVTFLEGLLERHVALYPGLDAQLALLCEGLYRLESVADYLRLERERMNFSPERLEDVEERLAGYSRLSRKYGGTISHVLQTRERLMQELKTIENHAEGSAQLGGELQLLYTELRQLAEELSRKRRAAIPLLVERFAAELKELGMPGALIQIAVSELRRTSEQGEEEGGDLPSIGESGLDRVEFLLRANEGESALPLRKVASGGELSRIMLALKSIIIGNSAPSSMLFDEVDAGVGGEAAHKIGSRLKNLARQGQVVVITHLHQIAGLADRHFGIFKELKDERTISQARELRGDNRLRELARMLGGNGPTVMQHAREILAQRSSLHPKQQQDVPLRSVAAGG